MRPRLALALWVVGAAAAVVALSAAGGGVLATPPVTDPGRLGPWVEEQGGVVAAFAVLRLVGLGLAWYLLATTVLAVMTRLAGAAAAVSFSDTFTTPMVRRLVESALTVSVTLGAVAPAGAPTTGAVAIAQVSEAEPETATLRLIEPAPAPPPAPTPAPAPSRTHVVQPGDHVWSIAERTLAVHLGRAPTEGEVTPYWRALIDRNAKAFTTGDPDLIFAGQTLELPDPTQA